MIYADFNGSSLLYPDVKKYLMERLESGPFGNPNAIHSIGKKLSTGIENTRKHLAKFLDCDDANQIIFNSGASEGISQVFCHLTNLRNDKKKILISKIEHAAIKNAAKYYEKLGFEMIEIGVDSNGVIEFSGLENIIKDHSNDICFVSIMAANNETGVIQPYQKIGELCQENNIPFFSDTTQYIGKIDFSFKNSNIDFAVCSSHKIGALIGSGFIIAKKPFEMNPLVFGGGQEFGYRGGTQNYIAIETMAIAMNAFEQQKKNLGEVEKYRDQFEKKLMDNFPEVVILGKKAKRLAGTCLISHPGLHGQGIQIELEANDIFVTTSSACSDNMPETSKVLKAMGVNDEVGRGVIRISLCCNASEQTFDKIYQALSNAYLKLKKIKYNNL